MKALTLIAKRFEVTRIIQPQKKHTQKKKKLEEKTKVFDWIPLHPYNNNILLLDRV